MLGGGSVQPLRAPSLRAQNGRRGRGATLLLATAALLFIVGCGYPVASAPACANAVLDDWTKGTLDSTHPANCYDAALDALPEDLRSYTTAAEDISRAAIAASRADEPQRRLAASAAPAGSDDVRAFPAQVVLLAVLVTVLAAGGTVASLIRHRRAR